MTTTTPAVKRVRKQNPEAKRAYRQRMKERGQARFSLTLMPGQSAALKDLSVYMERDMTHVIRTLIEDAWEEVKLERAGDLSND